MKKKYKKVFFGFIIFTVIMGILIFNIPTTRYIIIQGYYQIKILTQRKPISKILKSPNTLPQRKKKLQLVSKIRCFGIKLGLNNTKSYTTLYDTKGSPVVYVVSAAHKNQLKSVLWKFPIVGKVPYLGFFSKKDAKNEFLKLKNKGYDVLMHSVSAYSTIGIFSDPLYTSILDGNEEYLANIILHEMTHETVFIKGDMNFNENLASFIGEKGAMEFLKTKYGKDSLILKSSKNQKKDRKIFLKFMKDTYNELNNFYKSSKLNKENISRREEIFKKIKDKFIKEIKPKFKTSNYDFFTNLKINNAYILLNQSYNGEIETFEELYILQGENLKKTIAFFKSIKNKKKIRKIMQEKINRLKNKTKSSQEQARICQ